MPHDALGSAPMVRGRRPDVILGDRFGAACGRWVIDAAAALFTAQGFVVARNAPFAGGYITQHYGRPSRARPRAADRDRPRPLHGRAHAQHDSSFEDVATRLGAVLEGLADLGDAAAPLAAE